MTKPVNKQFSETPQRDGLKEQTDSSRADRLLVHPDDTVFVLLTAAADVPAGHKIARFDISEGDFVYKYGDPIGIAKQDIKAGEWVHTHNLKTALSKERFFSYQPDYRPLKNRQHLLKRETFSGYLRQNGRVGIRNEIWIVPTVGCVNKTAEKLAAYGRGLIENSVHQTGSIDTVCAWTHAYGCSQLGEDHAMTRQILLNLAQHPNAGGVLVLGLGCENNQPGTFRDMLCETDEKRIKFLVAQDTEDEIAAGQRLLRQLIAAASSDQRSACPIDQLMIGLKCGASDAFSGLTANPLLGRFSEWLIQSGGSTILTEIPEIFGAEPILLNRCADETVFNKLSDLLQAFRDYYTNYGQPVYENPSPGNKAGGITTLEEKSLGCTQKAGKAMVNDVLKYGEIAKRSGLSVLEGPGNDLVSCTALAAAGAQMLLFTTGRGNPLGGPVPTVKIASNHDLAARKVNWIDFDASPALAGESVWPELDKQFISQVLAIAEGRQKTKNEINEDREIAIFKQGVIL